MSLWLTEGAENGLTSGYRFLSKHLLPEVHQRNLFPCLGFVISESVPHILGRVSALQQPRGESHSEILDVGRLLTLWLRWELRRTRKCALFLFWLLYYYSGQAPERLQARCIEIYRKKHMFSSSCKHFPEHGVDESLSVQVEALLWRWFWAEGFIVIWRTDHCTAIQYYNIVWL